MIDETRISIIIPSKNEANSLRGLLLRLKEQFSKAEIIVVNDGSSDDTAQICESYGVKQLVNPYSMGNGAAIKAGTRVATGEVLVFMDADGQHDPVYIPLLLDKIDAGFDMVIGARETASQASFGRLIANTFYNKFSSYIVNQKVLDLTSGFRAVRASKFRHFLHLYPNGFSYPATSTMAFYRSGYAVSYAKIQVNARTGKSHIRWFTDGAKFLLILFKIAVLYSPLKLFVPASLLLFASGILYYSYTFLLYDRFTNMGALLFVSSIIVFLIGLVSEQITMLLYKNSDK